MTKDGRPGLPATGTPRADLLAEMAAMKGGDADWHGGRTFSLVYHVDDELSAVLREASQLFLFENALNPFAFPSLRRMESDVVAMTASLLGGGPGAAGSMTSGGSESIFLAVKAARDRARAERGVTEPEMLLPVTAHPAFHKAAHYLGVKVVPVPLGEDLRADVRAAGSLIGDQTALVVASAPCYPYGVIDPVEGLAAVAASHGAACHVDACLGGFLLPFWRTLGEPVPPFDLSVPGVTSISADVHKYGYCVKGASVILHASRELRRFQFFSLDGWVGGMYGSPTAAGTRPAGPMAAAWAVMRHLGEEGYVRLAGVVRDTARAFMAGIDALDGLAVWGRPDMSVFAFRSTDPAVDIAVVGDVMDERGWFLDRQPESLHVMVMPVHATVVDAFLADLAGAVAEARAGRQSAGREARYGG
jgi:sphinganine-1-phosphate aldolase